MIKVESGRVRDRIETVSTPSRTQTGPRRRHRVEAVGHGRQRGITHEYRGRVFESRFLPKASSLLVKDEIADEVVEAIADAARTGHESGDGLVWTTPVFERHPQPHGREARGGRGRMTTKELAIAAAPSGSSSPRFS